MQVWYIAWFLVGTLIVLFFHLFLYVFLFVLVIFCDLFGVVSLDCCFRFVVGVVGWFDCVWVFLAGQVLMFAGCAFVLGMFTSTVWVVLFSWSLYFMLLFGMVYYLICCFGLVLVLCCVGCCGCWGFGVLLLICVGSGLLCFAFNDVDMWVSFIDCVCCYLLLFSCLRLWSVCLAVCWVVWIVVSWLRVMQFWGGCEFAAAVFVVVIWFDALAFNCLLWIDCRVWCCDCFE